MNFEQVLIDTLKKTNAKLELLKKFTDLEEITDSYKITRLCSVMVNNLVTDCEFKFECDCCEDAKLFVYLSTTINDIKIYSKPNYVQIGKKFKDRIIPDDYWEDKLYDMGVKGATVLFIENHLYSSAPDIT